MKTRKRKELNKLLFAQAVRRVIRGTPKTKPEQELVEAISAHKLFLAEVKGTA